MFLHFLCEDGNINTEGSIHQYLLQFKQLYNEVNGHDMNKDDAKQALIVYYSPFLYFFITLVVNYITLVHPRRIAKGLSPK